MWLETSWIMEKVEPKRAKTRPHEECASQIHKNTPLMIFFTEE